MKLQDSTLHLFNIPNNLGVNVPLDFTNVGMTEQTAGLGILGFLIVLPFSIVGFFNKKLKIFSLVFWGQIIALSFAIAYMVYSIRFVTGFSVFLIPLITLSYTKKKFLKGMVIFFALIYLSYASIYISQRPLIKLTKEIKKHNLEYVQTKMRDLNLPFYSSFTEGRVLKETIEPVCNSNNRIGFVAPNVFMMFSTKYLELNNSCKIDTINLLHIKNLDYDYLIIQTNLIQQLDVINQNDIKNPLFNDYNVACHFVGRDEKRNEILLNYNGINKANQAICKLNPDALERAGFKAIRDVAVDTPKHLKFRENETIKSLTLYKKM